MRIRLRPFLVTGLALVACLSLAGRVHAQSGGVQAQGATIRLVRSVSGSKGAPQGGRFVMEDPRSVFYVPDDRQVIVYMEWEGPLGKHHIEGFWRNPQGKPSVFTDFDYESKDKRFGAYFTLTLAEGVDIGTWSLEAHVDGEQTGSHTVQIMTGKRPDDAIPARKPLSPPQLYERALQSAVNIEALDRTGRTFRAGSGFLMEPNCIMTAFEVIDGATKLRVSYPDNSRMETDQVLAWNRRQDWVILQAIPAKSAKLQRAPAGSWTIADTSVFLDVAVEGNRVLTSVSIDGQSTFPGAGMRISLSSSPAEHSIGAALFNEFGEVIGIIGGAVIPGAQAMNFLDWAGSSTGGILRGGLAVPITMIPALPANTSATPLGVLDAKGEFLPPVTASRNVAFAQLARTLDNKGSLPFPIDGGSSFSKRDPKVNVFVSWQGREKAKGFVTMRLFDLDNHLLDKAWVEKPMKFSINVGEQKVTNWVIPTATMPAGIYRVDVWLDDAPAWRTFWKLSE